MRYWKVYKKETFQNREENKRTELLSQDGEKITANGKDDGVLKET